MKIINGEYGVTTAWGVQSGSGEKQWNHTQFTVTDESERTKRFVIPNDQTITQLYIRGGIEESTYDVDSLCVFVGDKFVAYPNGAPTASKKYFILALERIVDVWVGRGQYTEWGTTPGYTVALGTFCKQGENYSDGTGDIRISTRWATLDFLEGTSIDVWWR